MFALPSPVDLSVWTHARLKLCVQKVLRVNPDPSSCCCHLRPGWKVLLQACAVRTLMRSHMTGMGPKEVSGESSLSTRL